MNKLIAKMLVEQIKSNETLNYEDAYNQALLYEEILAGMTPENWDWVNIRQRLNRMYELCTALNIHLELGETRHLSIIPVIYSYGKNSVVKEETVMISKVTASYRLESAVLDAIRSKLREEGIHYQKYMDLEVVMV